MANLITLDEYKEYKGKSSNKDDDRLSALIVSVSQVVKTYCANSFVDYVTIPKVELVSIPWPVNLIQLTESPVIELITVKERSSYGADLVTLEAANFDYFYDESKDTLYRTSSAGFKNWATGPAAVEITYKAGYTTIPQDLKLAVMDLVTYYFEGEYKERKTLGSVSVTNQFTSTQWRNVGFPDHIKRILDLHKVV